MILNYIDPSQIILLFTILALFLFAFVFWKDSTQEGFSSDKVLDTYFMVLIGGIVGGKVLFRQIDYNYLKYELLSSPLILEGVLVGGGIMVYLAVKKNKWSGWKIGDMIAPALALFQAILFLGVYLASSQKQDLIIFISFVVLYALIRYLKVTKNLGRSGFFIERRRLKKAVFTGGLLALYATVSSLIAILFLIIYANYLSWFWWFQFLFYLSVFIVTILLVRNKLSGSHKQMTFKSYINKFNILDKLQRRRGEIKKESAFLKKQDPFVIEGGKDGNRKIESIEDEVSDLSMHADVERAKTMLKEEEKEVKDAVNKIKTGEYGICENCKKAISKDRLQAYPTAKLCIDCERKLEQ